MGPLGIKIDSETAFLRVSVPLWFKCLFVSENLHLRYRHDKAAAPRTILRLLRQDLLGEVSAQQQHEIRLPLPQRLRREDRNMHSRHVASLLVRAAVYHELQSLAADTEVVQQRAALG